MTTIRVLAFGLIVAAVVASGGAAKSGAHPQASVTTPAEFFSRRAD